MGATRMRSATYRAGQSVRGFPRNQSDLPALRIGGMEHFSDGLTALTLVRWWHSVTGSDALRWVSV